SLRPALDHRPVKVDADETAAGLVDPRLTPAALSHLLENARQYSPADQPIELRGFVDADGLHIVVRDHGDGIDAAEIDQVFNKFFRGRRAGERTRGAGMGRAITRGLLAAEGGRVWAENAPGGGASFTIAIPSQSHVVSAQ